MARLYREGPLPSQTKKTTTIYVLHATDIIDAADKYGVVNLKLEAEARLVEDTVITIENVMDLLVYAESKNLALLKEVVMDYIVENKDALFRSYLAMRSFLE